MKTLILPIGLLMEEVCSVEQKPCMHAAGEKMRVGR